MCVFPKLQQKYYSYKIFLTTFTSLEIIKDRESWGPMCQMYGNGNLDSVDSLKIGLGARGQF